MDRSAMPWKNLKQRMQNSTDSSDTAVWKLTKMPIPSSSIPVSWNESDSRVFMHKRSRNGLARNISPKIISVTKVPLLTEPVRSQNSNAVISKADIAVIIR